MAPSPKPQGHQAPGVCPADTYYDTGPDCTFQATPFFVVQTMSCPCTGGGGGGGGGEDDEDGGDGGEGGEGGEG